MLDALLAFAAEHFLTTEPAFGHYLIAVVFGVAVAPAVRRMIKGWLGADGEGGKGRFNRRNDDGKWDENAREHAHLESKVDDLRRDADEKFSDIAKRIDRVYELVAKLQGGGK